ncbi:hypothetical protein ACFQ2Y_00470 [Streptomyces malaysiensis subsp. malaysiensis]
MDDPVFVIHGVANRDQEGFTATVADLQTASGLDMVPIYWGDLGADDRFVTAALPTRPVAVPGARKSGGLRGMNEPPSPVIPEPALVSALASAPQAPDQWTQVETAVRERLASAEQQAGSGMRDGPRHGDADGILEYLAGEWRTTEWLRRTDDSVLLFETGRSLAEALIEAADLRADGAGSYDGLRAGDEGEGRLRRMVRNRLRDLDRVAGAAIQATAGRLNDALRTKFGPGTTRFWVTFWSTNATGRRSTPGCDSPSTAWTPPWGAPPTARCEWPPTALAESSRSTWPPRPPPCGRPHW